MIRPLTSNELFHFTNFENILGIIANGFYPHYNLEYTYLSNLFERPAVLFAVPMVCFCDLPTYLTEEHSSKYGKCAIGMKKDWGYKNGLNPITYITANSKLSDAHSGLVNSFNKYHSSKVSNMEIIYMITQALKSTSHLGCFMKQYERTNEVVIIINGIQHTFPKGRFYDEREWRFVPYSNQGELMIINSNDITDEMLMKSHNEKLKEHKLSFELSDITHVLIERDAQEEVITNVLANKFNCDPNLIQKSIDLLLMDQCWNYS